MDASVLDQHVPYVPAAKGITEGEYVLHVGELAKRPHIDVFMKLEPNEAVASPSDSVGFFVRGHAQDSSDTIWLAVPLAHVKLLSSLKTYITPPTDEGSTNPPTHQAPPEDEETVLGRWLYIDWVNMPHDDSDFEHMKVLQQVRMHYPHIRTPFTLWELYDTGVLSDGPRSGLSDRWMTQGEDLQYAYRYGFLGIGTRESSILPNAPGIHLLDQMCREREPDGRCTHTEAFTTWNQRALKKH